MSSPASADTSPGGRQRAGRDTDDGMVLVDGQMMGTMGRPSAPGMCSSDRDILTDQVLYRERTTGFEPATLTLATRREPSVEPAAVPCHGLLSACSSAQPVHSVYRSTHDRRLSIGSVHLDEAGPRQRGTRSQGRRGELTEPSVPERNWAMAVNDRVGLICRWQGRGGY